jgi:hypothetical protein
MNIIKCLIPLLLLTACHRPIIGQSQDVIIVDCIRKENNYNLATGGLVRIGKADAYDEVSGTLKESYQTRKIHFNNLDQARVYFVKIFNEYVKPFNANKRLKTMVKSFPFTSKNTEIEVTFIDGRSVPHAAPDIARIRNDFDRLLFYSYDPEKGTFDEIANELF